MSIEFSPAEITEIKKRLIEKGINLKNRRIAFGSKTDIRDGQQTIIRTVHIPTRDGCAGPEYEIPQLLQD